MPGTINQYEIRQTLGSGFSCKVKLGVDTNTGRNVAIKIIREGDEELMDLVRTETQAMSKIAKHDHVVEQIEVGRAIYKKEPKNGMPGKEKEVDFIVLEICPGGEIFDFVAVSGAFSEDQARYFFSQFIEGLLHCHNKGFAHRDLKPENLLLGKNYDLKIADFGFAGPINGRGGVGYLETPLGTEAYMAPELIKRQKYRGAQVDIFAAAAVLFILVAQHPPFNKANEKDDPFYKMLAANRADLFWKQHCKHKPGKDKFFSDDFKDLIQSMLQLEASHRPSFSEILGHPWMKGNMPDKATIVAEFEKRHFEVKNNAALEKLEKEAQQKKVKVTLPEQSNAIQPMNKLNFETHKAGGWEFYHSVQGMSSEPEMDMVSDRVGIMGLPEVFFGFNNFIVVNKQHNVLLSFNAVDSLSYSGYEKRKQFLTEEAAKDLSKNEEEKQSDVEQLTANLAKMLLENSGLTEDEKKLNLIDLVPENVQVKMASHWKSKDTSKIKDFTQVESTSDWTFSTPYKGTVRYLSQGAASVREQTSLELEHTSKEEASIDHLSVVQKVEATIPFDMLSPENPILHFGEVYLFESDLEDCGYMMSKVRFRVMADCWYILLRYYLRVDGVRVRSFDTRIFHAFGSDNIHREFQHRESSYEELQKSGFDFDPEWILSPNQSDMVFPKLIQKKLIQEQIRI